ncbi:uncharacterized protein LOC121406634 [Lytechinus variegatus]|uniref:uncharacterized protein LOC121406634 n=1 Tax=Lytechinus variegatus TaxID=7654 RepID=UPI001BB1D278|nr:uncharacterized protein LOC121406634 [Lytechinus variegatus]
MYFTLAVSVPFAPKQKLAINEYESDSNDNRKLMDEQGKESQQTLETTQHLGKAQPNAKASHQTPKRVHQTPETAELIAHDVQQIHEMPETMKQIAEVTQEFLPTVQEITAEEGQLFPNDIDQILFDGNDVRISNTKSIVEELLDIAQDMQMQGISETNHQTPERVHQTPERAELIAHDVQQIREMPETKQIAEVTQEVPPTVQQIAAEEGQQLPNDIENRQTLETTQHLGKAQPKAKASHQTPKRVHQTPGTAELIAHDVQQIHEMPETMKQIAEVTQEFLPTVQEIAAEEGQQFLNDIENRQTLETTQHLGKAQPKAKASHQTPKRVHQTPGTAELIAHDVQQIHEMPETMKQIAEVTQEFLPTVQEIAAEEGQQFLNDIENRQTLETTQHLGKAQPKAKASHQTPKRVHQTPGTAELIAHDVQQIHEMPETMKQIAEVTQEFLPTVQEIAAEEGQQFLNDIENRQTLETTQHLGKAQPKAKASHQTPKRVHQTPGTAELIAHDVQQIHEMPETMKQIAEVTQEFLPTVQEIAAEEGQQFLNDIESRQTLETTQHLGKAQPNAKASHQTPKRVHQTPETAELIAHDVHQIHEMPETMKQIAEVTQEFLPTVQEIAAEEGQQFLNDIENRQTLETTQHLGKAQPKAKASHQTPKRVHQTPGTAELIAHDVQQIHEMPETMKQIAEVTQEFLPTVQEIAAEEGQQFLNDIENRQTLETTQHLGKAQPIAKASHQTPKRVHQTPETAELIAHDVQQIHETPGTMKQIAEVTQEFPPTVQEIAAEEGQLFPNDIENRQTLETTQHLGKAQPKAKASHQTPKRVHQTPGTAELIAHDVQQIHEMPETMKQIAEVTQEFLPTVQEIAAEEGQQFLNDIESRQTLETTQHLGKAQPKAKASHQTPKRVHHTPETAELIAHDVQQIHEMPETMKQIAEVPTNCARDYKSRQTLETTQHLGKAQPNAKASHQTPKRVHQTPETAELIAHDVQQIHEMPETMKQIAEVTQEFLPTVQEITAEEGQLFLNDIESRQTLETTQHLGKAQPNAKVSHQTPKRVHQTPETAELIAHDVQQIHEMPETKQIAEVTQEFLPTVQEIVAEEGQEFLNDIESRQTLETTQHLGKAQPNAKASHQTPKRVHQTPETAELIAHDVQQIHEMPETMKQIAEESRQTLETTQHLGKAQPNAKASHQTPKRVHQTPETAELIAHDVQQIHEMPETMKQIAEMTQEFPPTVQEIAAEEGQLFPNDIENRQTLETTQHLGMAQPKAKASHQTPKRVHQTPETAELIAHDVQQIHEMPETMKQIAEVTQEFPPTVQEITAEEGQLFPNDIESRQTLETTQHLGKAQPKAKASHQTPKRVHQTPETAELIAHDVQQIHEMPDDETNQSRQTLETTQHLGKAQPKAKASHQTPKRVHQTPETAELIAHDVQQIHEMPETMKQIAETLETTQHLGKAQPNAKASHQTPKRVHQTPETAELIAHDVQQIHEMPETMKQIAEVTQEFLPTVQEIAAEEGQLFLNDIESRQTLETTQHLGKAQPNAKASHQTPKRVHQTPETAELIAHDVQQIHEMPETMKQIAEMTQEFPPTVQEIAAEEGQLFPNDIESRQTLETTQHLGKAQPKAKASHQTPKRVHQTPETAELIAHDVQQIHEMPETMKQIAEVPTNCARDYKNRQTLETTQHLRKAQPKAKASNQTPKRVHQTPETAELIAHDVQQIHEMPETMKQIAEVTQEFPPTVQEITAEEGQLFPNDIENRQTLETTQHLGMAQPKAKASDQTPKRVHQTPETAELIAHDVQQIHEMPETMKQIAEVTQEFPPTVQEITAEEGQLFPNDIGNLKSTDSGDDSTSWKGPTES